MTSFRSLRSVAALAALCASALVAVGAAGGTPIASAQVTSLASGGEYHPVTPTRIFDTRGAGINDTAPLGPKPANAAGQTFTFDALGQGGIPAEVAGANRDVLAVVLNITVDNPSRAGYLSIAPAGSAAGTSSLVNFNAGENVPNLAVVGAGTNGAVSVTLVMPEGAGNANVLVDVFGWVSKSDYPDTDDSGARFQPVGPGRILDTRSSPVPAGYTSGTPLGPDGRLKLQIRGADAVLPSVTDIVPDDPNVTGVMVNITAVAQTLNTFVSATPGDVPGGTLPTTSNTNLSRGQVKANMAIVPVGADGSIRLYNAYGNTHLIVDVLGYLYKGADAATTTGRVVPLDAPFRVFDTRQPEFGAAPLGFATSESWSFADFTDSVKLGGVPLGAQTAFIGNLTGTGLTRLPGFSQPVTTYMTMYPGGAVKPESSNINLVEGQSVPNMSLLRYGTAGTDDNVINAYNFNGSVHYLLDVYAVVLA